MPQWGFAMTQGRVGEWLAAEGSEISSGDQVLEVETDKAIGVVESPIAGILRRHVAQPGEEIPVGGLLGIVADASVPDDEIDRFVEGSIVAGATKQTESLEPTPEFVQVGDRTIRYLRQGKGGSPVVLVHGFTGNLNNWLFNHAALAEERTVCALDLPGHGLSSKDVGDGSIETLAGVLCDWMDALKLPPAHLVGHSLGGAIVLDTAFRHPERLLSCTLISSAGLGSEIDVDYLDGVVKTDRRKQLKPWLERLFADPDQVTRQAVDDLLKFKRVDGVRDALTTITGQLTADGQQSVVFRDHLNQLNMPVLVVWGERDQIIPHQHAADLPEGWQVKVLAECGHMVQMEAALPVNKLVADFIRQCCQTGRK
ncbi:MAG: acetoin dehydrogenase dihydrolipoyllysine-residue acetyltransferase subunit [Planctomycetaceae bacterium]